MANKNDFKILHQTCLRYFEAASVCLGLTESSKACLQETQKARYGFYYFVIQQLTSLVDFNEITESITDQEFNSRFFKLHDNDNGVDAIYIDNLEHTISLFNFKYRNTYNSDQEQKKTEALPSSVFIAQLDSDNTEGFSGKIKDFAEEIIRCYNSSEIWTTTFYYVSNESKTLDVNSSVFSVFKKYSVDVKTIALDEIVEISSIRPKTFDAKIVLPSDAIMSFTESSLASSKSYIVRMPLTDLVRITCSDDAMRNNYNLENDNDLFNVDIDFQVLFDNVRGFIARSKYNQNIEATLNICPTKFFFYNNGITIVAEDIHSFDINSGKRVMLQIHNFQVLNGGQTLRTIHNFNKKSPQNIVEKLSHAEILVRLLNVTEEDTKGKIGEYTNSQNMINQQDLKSLRTEQIQLERYLKDFEILYLRKKGDTGVDPHMFKYTLGMDLMGQILLAVSGRPEMISNKKREIFASFYDELFVSNSELLSVYTVKLIKKYFQFKKQYKTQKRKATVQKIMYILYLDSRYEIRSFEHLCDDFERYIENYMTKNKIEKSASRTLIESKFKRDLDTYMAANYTSKL